MHFDWRIRCGATFIFPSIISSYWCITTSCVKHRKEVISFLLRGHKGRRVGWGQYRSAGRKPSVSVTATARELRKLWACRPERVRTAARLCFFPFFLADNKLLRCHGVFSGNHSLSWGESDAGCWETVILFQAGCGGQQALWPRKHFGKNTPLKLAWPSVCVQTQWLTRLPTAAPSGDDCQHDTRCQLSRLDRFFIPTADTWRRVVFPRGKWAKDSCNRWGSPQPNQSKSVS